MVFGSPGAILQASYQESQAVAALLASVTANSLGSCEACPPEAGETEGASETCPACSAPSPGRQPAGPSQQLHCLAVDSQQLMLKRQLPAVAEVAKPLRHFPRPGMGSSPPRGSAEPWPPCFGFDGKALDAAAGGSGGMAKSSDPDQEPGQSAGAPGRGTAASGGTGIPGEEDSCAGLDQNASVAGLQHLELAASARYEPLHTEFCRSSSLFP